MRHLPHAAVLLLSGIALSGCADVFGPQSCGVAPGSAFNVITRDQFGTGQALGAVVVFHDDSSGHADTTSRLDDTLSDYGGVQNRYYDIQVSKRYYTDGWARHVITYPDGCGLGLSRVTVTIQLIPGSPAIRTMNMLPQAFWLDPAEDQPTLTFRPFIDADPGVSRAVRWTITGDSTAATFDPVAALLTYHCQPLTTHTTFTATLLADTTLVASSLVTVQGHPVSAADPRCR